MELKVKKLGRIEAASLELRPLTVLVGPNHTNKSWLAYAAFDLMTSLAWRAWESESWQFSGLGEALAAVDRAFSALKGPSGAVTLTFDRARIGEAEGSNLSRENLAAQLGLAASALSTESSAELDLSEEDQKRAKFSALELRLERAGRGWLLSARFSRADGGPELQETLALEHAAPEDYAEKVSHWLRLLKDTLAFRAVVLPVARQTMLAYGVRLPKTTGRVPTPGYLRAFSALLDELRAQGSPEDEGPMGDAPALLRRAMGGSLERGELGSVRFRPTGSRRLLPLGSSASGAQSLAALSLYLESLAQPGDFLIIDEPELCLHPAAQLALVELLAVLVRRGLRVLYTTHSPYMVDHLNNLMGLYRLREAARRQVSSRFQLGTPECWLNPEEVAVHELVEQDGAVLVKSGLDRQEAMVVTDTFGRWSDQLSTLYNALLDVEEAR